MDEATEIALQKLENAEHLLQEASVKMEEAFAALAAAGVSDPELNTVRRLHQVHLAGEITLMFHSSVNDVRDAVEARLGRRTEGRRK